MKTIGLTGNIASGKSTVLAMLRELGAVTLDADAVVHDLLKRGSSIFGEVLERFSPEAIADENGEIDRAKLGAIVFADAGRLRDLESIVHPAVRDRVFEWWTAQKERSEKTGKPPVAVIDAVKLLESPTVELCDTIWVVVAPLEEQLRRLVLLRGMPEPLARDRLSRQPEVTDRIRRADVVIDNGGTIAATRHQVEQAWAALLADVPYSGLRND